MTETYLKTGLIGYAGVSTYGQTLDGQFDSLRAAGCSSRNIYRGRVTGVGADRRELNGSSPKLALGDVVTVRASTGGAITRFFTAAVHPCFFLIPRGRA